MDELRAFLFGVTLAAAVGPIALLVMRNGLNHGLRPALASALGVALADLTYAGIALGAGALVSATLDAQRGLFEAMSSALLLALGLWLTGSALRAAAVDAGTSAPAAVGLLPTYLLTLANPLTVLLFVGLAGQLALAQGWRDAARFALLIFLGSLPVQAIYALSGAALQRFVSDPRHVRALNGASGVAIAGFGAYGLIRLV
jgi:threonine/homoserine/homoserine lactone efflux protein